MELTAGWLAQFVAVDAAPLLCAYTAAAVQL